MSETLGRVHLSGKKVKRHKNESSRRDDNDSFKSMFCFLKEVTYLHEKRTKYQQLNAKWNRGILEVASFHYTKEQRFDPRNSTSKCPLRIVTKLRLSD